MMSNRRSSVILNKMAWFIGPGEDIISVADVEISVSEPRSFDFKGAVCLIQDRETTYAVQKYSYEITYRSVRNK